MSVPSPGRKASSSRASASKRLRPMAVPGSVATPNCRSSAPASGASSLSVAAKPVGPSVVGARRNRMLVPATVPSSATRLSCGRDASATEAASAILRSAGDRASARCRSWSAAWLGARRPVKASRSRSRVASSRPSRCAVRPSLPPVRSAVAPPTSARRSRSSVTFGPSLLSCRLARPVSTVPVSLCASLTARAARLTDRSRLDAAVAVSRQSGSASRSSASEVRSAKSRARSAPTARVSVMVPVNRERSSVRTASWAAKPTPERSMAPPKATLRAGSA